MQSSLEFFVLTTMGREGNISVKECFNLILVSFLPFTSTKENHKQTVTKLNHVNGIFTTNATNNDWDIAQLLFESINARNTCDRGGLLMCRLGLWLHALVFFFMLVKHGSCCPFIVTLHLTTWQVQEEGVRRRKKVSKCRFWCHRKCSLWCEV